MRARFLSMRDEVRIGLFHTIPHCIRIARSVRTKTTKPFRHKGWRAFDIHWGQVPRHVREPLSPAYLIARPSKIVAQADGGLSP